MRSIVLTTLAATFAGLAAAYNNECNNNIVEYWGQNSYGAANGNDPSGWQQPLRFYCNDDTVDVLPIAFLTTFFGKNGEPEINLANYCNSVDNATFPGSNLANCQNLSSDIEYCQSKGKLVTISLGGATGGVGFQSDAQASSFADTLWNLFFGGKSNTRPFGDAILDGIDLDIEGGGPNHYVTFLNKLNGYFKSASKKYYVTAAPQCVYPDANLQTTLNGYPFDAVYVQFYNNPCGLQNYNSASQWNFGIWDLWARTVSPNPNVKIYIGAPASSSAAGGGYVDAATLSKIAVNTRNSFPSFGGVMFWDASQAYKNNRIDNTVKSALASGKRCDGGFTYPACTAPAYSAGTMYPGGTTVSYNAYMWTAKWYASSAPSNNVNSDWSPISACSGSGGSGPTTTTSASKTTTTTTSTTTTRSSITTTTTKTSTTTTSATPTTTSTGGNCAGVSAWSSSNIYTNGNRVTYQGSLWQAKWWTQNDVPGGLADVWTNLGSCSSSLKRRRSKRSLRRSF
ncbi:glycoside hydrolase superfamily [Mycotypha africana]|uniref:glycoside hydrolase superfamily n=1 Tax=Mycotypha africana TaxID=64632 RepID=UPI0023002920|nr:glycoside hydrolase superfamily [Mycotypha africana]KAI8979496.1 glycoside hydrolase superfamily [Mycotypha africana]